MDITTTDRSLLHLMQLSSVSLPVGGYSFSQGLETAIDCGWVKNAEQVHEWLRVQLQQSLAHVDLPILRLVLSACDHKEWLYISHCNDLALACRETHELHLTDAAMGKALLRLMNSLNIPIPKPLTEQSEFSFVVLFAIACHHWQINFSLAAQGYGWSWLENQVAAATKLVPLGQTQSQQLLLKLQLFIPEAIDHSINIDEWQIGAGLPALAIASADHETQYSRLFRS